MIGTVKNQNDAYNLVDEFVRWLNDVRKLHCEEDAIAVTSDTVENFIAACEEIDSGAEVEAFPPEFVSLEGGKIYELIGAKHPVKGRCDIYILDTGDYRLVYVE